MLGILQKQGVLLLFGLGELCGLPQINSTYSRYKIVVLVDRKEHPVFVSSLIKLAKWHHRASHLRQKRQLEFLNTPSSLVTASALPGTSSCVRVRIHICHAKKDSLHTFCNTFAIQCSILHYHSLYSIIQTYNYTQCKLHSAFVMGENAKYTC